jgi:hypothetical protein
MTHSRSHAVALQSYVGLCPLFSFLMFYTVGKTPWTGDQRVARPLPTHTGQHKQIKRTQTSMPQVGFEATIPVFESATVIGSFTRLY